MNLDGAPLPDEPFAWVGIADDIRPAVQEMLTLCDDCADELFDVEHRGAARRRTKPRPVVASRLG